MRFSPSENPAVNPDGRQAPVTFSRLHRLRQQYRSQGIGIHYVIRGEVGYRIDHQPFKVGAGHYVLIGDGQEVSLTLEADECPVERLLVQLPYPQVQGMYKELKGTIEDPCEDPFAEIDGKVAILEHVYSVQGNVLGQLLQELSQSPACQRELAAREGEAFLDELTERLLLTQGKVFQRLARMSSAKLSTKKELYRRLCMAHRYIHEHLGNTLDLDTLAQVACLSKFHFIRLFKEVYGQTPRQYLIAQRLDRASNLLKHSEKSFHEICQEVGLKDSSSFGRLFKRSFGATPQIYRQMHGGGRGLGNKGIGE
jgi:AraC family transcriptional regulator